MEDKENTIINPQPNGTRKELRQMCFQLARHYIDKGFTPLQTRTAIVEWASANNITMEFNLNSVINNAMKRDE